MKRILKVFLAGMITLTLLFTTFSIFANDIQQSISVVLNKVNVAINGVLVGKSGTDYTLDNGQKVPYSISYKGTTYLPIRKVAELMGKVVTWNGVTATAGINDVAPSPTATPSPTPTASQTLTYTSVGKRGYAPVVNIGGKIYLFGYAPYIITDNKNNMYIRFDQEPINIILSIAYNEYKIEMSENPFVSGYISPLYPMTYNATKDLAESKFIEVDRRFLSVSQEYKVYRIFDIQKTKYYEIQNLLGAEKGIVTINRERYIPLNDLFSTIGSPVISFTNDDEKQMCVFEIR